MGRPLYRGGVVHGTDKAVREEFATVFAKARGEEGREMRERMEDVKEMVRRRSEKEGGEGWEAMRELAKGDGGR